MCPEGHGGHIGCIQMVTGVTRSGVLCSVLRVVGFGVVLWFVFFGFGF